MRCDQCAAEVPEGAGFCPMCGHKVGDATAPPADAPQSKAQALQQKAVQVRHAGDVAEQELWRGTYSYKAMLAPAIGAGVASLVGLIIMIWMPPLVRWIILGAILVLWLWLGLSIMRKRIGIHYRLTNQRFFIESGVFRRVTDRIEVIDINDMEFVQDFFERFFDVGSIMVSSTDRSVPKVTLDGIEHVEAVFNLIDQARRAERNRRGLYIEAS